MICLPEVSCVELVGVVGPLPPVCGDGLAGEGEGDVCEGGEAQVAGLGQQPPKAGHCHPGYVLVTQNLLQNCNRLFVVGHLVLNF